MRTKGLTILIALALAAGAFAYTGSPPTTLELISSAYERGEIAYTDYALYKLYLIFGDADRIPDAYRGNDSLAGVSGTMMIHDAGVCVLKGLFDEEELAEARMYLGRPTEEAPPGSKRGYGVPPQDINHWDTPEGNFRMWWVEMGPNALLYPEDDDDSGVPDIVELVAEGLEYALTIFVGEDKGELRFDYPVKDGTWYPEGADYGYVEGDTQEDWERFDSYFRFIESGAMAYCQYEQLYEETYWDDASFHMVFRNNVDPDDVDIVEKTTAAHELHHGVQAGIDYDNPSHVKEKTSVWSEERVYPLANNYQGNRLGAFMALPHIGLTRHEGLSWYNSVIWSHYFESLTYQTPELLDLMEDSYDLEGVQQVNAITMYWENYERRTEEGVDLEFCDIYDLIFRDAFPDMVFEDETGGMAYAFGKFIEWNWFTDHRCAARSGNEANNNGLFYIDDLNINGYTFGDYEIPPEGGYAVAYPEVNDLEPDGYREFTGDQVVTGVEIQMTNDGGNIKGCPDGLGSDYFHIVQLAPIPEDAVFAFKGYPENEEDSKFWGASYILMQNDAQQHTIQTSGDLSTKMNIFGDKGIIRINNAALYHEIAFIPYVRLDMGGDLQFMVKIDAVSAGDRNPPSFNPADGGALQLALIPSFGSHIEFTATPNELLFACPRYDITFTEVDDKGDFVDEHYWRLNGNQNADD
ncbi:hypothetical protein KAU45_06320, partial [bacterium]|nr:hypothetical protein [bacterium]